MKGLDFPVFTLPGSSIENQNAHFSSKKRIFSIPEIKDVFRNCFGTRVRGRFVTRKIYELKRKLKDRLYEFIEKFEIDLLVPENALTIPLNIPFGYSAYRNHI